jgi:hypothetical protein
LSSLREKRIGMCRLRVLGGFTLDGDAGGPGLLDPGRRLFSDRARPADMAAGGGRRLVYLVASGTVPGHPVRQLSGWSTPDLTQPEPSRLVLGEGEYRQRFHQQPSFLPCLVTDESCQPTAIPANQKPTAAQNAMPPQSPRYANLEESPSPALSIALSPRQPAKRNEPWASTSPTTITRNAARRGSLSMLPPNDTRIICGRTGTRRFSTLRRTRATRHLDQTELLLRRPRVARTSPGRTPPLVSVRLGHAERQDDVGHPGDSVVLFVGVLEALDSCLTSGR